tara:strand:- start:10846 stop:11310 length:465 start_codon:yes stop_codon:yes gene_type:complete
MTIHFGDSTSLTTAPTSVDTSGIRPNTVVARGGASTTSDNFVDAFSVNITPLANDSKLFVLGTGTIAGHRQGNNSQNNASGHCALFRGNSQIGSTATAGSTNSAFAGECLLDTNNHGGSTQTYKFRMHKSYGGNRSNNQPAYLRTASITVIEVL